MHGNIIQFNMISHFAIRLFGAPGLKIFCLGDGFSGGFVAIVIVHVNLLVEWWIKMLQGKLFSFLAGQAKASY